MSKEIINPSRYINLGRKGLLPFLLITIAALYQLQFLEKENSLSSDFPENHKILEQIQNNNSHFTGNGNFILLMLKPDNDNLAESLKDLAFLSHELQTIPEVDIVLTPLELMDFKDDGFSWESIPLVHSELNTENEIKDFYTAIRDIDLYRKLFLGKENNLVFYAFPIEGIDPVTFAAAVREWIDEGGYNLSISGVPLLQYFYKDMINKDTITLPLIALILILVIEYLLYRKIKISLILGLASFIPTVWALALFPIFKLPMSLDNLIAPILVLGLASSYGIHLIRGKSVFPTLGMGGVLDKIGGKIAIAGLTTMLGFTSLLMSPTGSIVQFGLITILGIIFALVFSLYALPLLFSNSAMPTDHGQKMMGKLHKPTGSRNSIYLLLLLVIILVYGVFDIYMDSRILSLLPEKHEYHDLNNALDEGFGGINELELILDTGEEYKLVTSDIYESLSLLIGSLEQLSVVSAVISYIDFIDWMYSRILTEEGFQKSEYPDEYFVGESLEILSDYELDGMQLSSLINPSYRYAKILIRYSNVQGRESWDDYSNLIASIEKLMNKSKFESYSISGSSVIQYHLIESHKKTILRGLLLFFPILFAICLIYTKSLHWTLCIISSPVLGALTYFGTMGLLNIPLSIPPLIAITCILGVSVDDNVFYTLSMMNKMKEQKSFREALIESYNETGGAIMDTSLAIVFVMFCLFFSNNLAIRQAGVLIIISQLVVTIYTLWFLPMFYPRFFKEKSK